MGNARRQRMFRPHDRNRIDARLFLFPKHAGNDHPAAVISISHAVLLL
jgi:hypothetical protein